jgi:hypothetical protein
MMRKAGFSSRLIFGVTAIFVVICLASVGALFAQKSGCERCHTDEASLKSLFKPTKAAPADEGEG